MIEEIDYQNQLGYGMHSRNEYQSFGSMMSPGYGHGMMMKPHIHHQSGFMQSQHQGGYPMQQQHHQSHMGHYHGPGGAKMSSSSMNSSHYSNGGMFGGSDMSRTEYDSFQKVHTPGLMHESKYHHQEHSGGYGGGFMPGAGYGARRTEWVSKGL